MKKLMYDLFLYLTDKIDKAVMKEAISRVEKTNKGRRSKYTAEVTGSCNNEEFEVDVFNHKGVKYCEKINIKDILID